MKERRIRLSSLKNKRVFAEKCVVAESFWSRLKGLIGTKTLEPGQGMFFPDCRDIHMWFMSTPIDVVFLKKISEGRWSVTSAHSCVRPWRLLPLADWKANDTIELPVGTIEQFALQTGDEICTV